MMERIAKLTATLSVSPQISEADVEVLAALGFKAIINNRPDGEGGPGQPTSAAIARAAARHGMDYRHIPVVPGAITDGDIAAFGQALAEMHGPVLGFCRSGTRSATLWALSQAPHLDTDAILKACAEAGYDLAALRPRLAALRQSAAPAARGR